MNGYENLQREAERYAELVVWARRRNAIKRAFIALVVAAIGALHLWSGLECQRNPQPACVWPTPPPP